MASVLVYNPSCEMAVRNDRVNYMPPAQIVSFEHDLAGLMMFVAESEADAVVAPRPDEMLLRTWFSPGSEPRFVSLGEGRSAVLSGCGLRPWGQSREVLHRFGLTAAAREWGLRDWLSRRTSVLVENELRRAAVGVAGLGFGAEPRLVSSRGELQEVIAEMQGEVVLKSLWSSSGRGVVIARGEDIEALTVWGERAIAADGAVVVERRLEREEEMTLLFERGASGDVSYRGLNRYRSADSGRFGKELVSPSDIVEADLLAEAVELLCHALQEVLSECCYAGPIGVDAMTYRQEGRRLFRPCTEVNMRHTMGNVGMAVRRSMATGVHAWWEIGQFRSAGEWDAFCAEAERRSPLRRDSEGKMTGGFFRLTGLSETQRFAAYGWIGEGK